MVRDRAPCGQWGRIISEVQGANEVATNAAGDVVVLTGYAGSIDFGVGLHTTSGDRYHHCAVAKFDGRGAPLWSREFDLGFHGTAHLALDGAGNTTWARSFTASGAGEVYSVAASEDGDIAVAGWLDGTDALGCEPLDRTRGCAFRLQPVG